MNTTRQEINESDPARENLLDWLRNAHAMEMQAEKMLKSQAERLEHYPEMKARVQQHVTETQQQARDVEQCLKSLGEGTSAVKDMSGKSMAMLQAMGGMIMDDEVIKGAAASYAFEHMEVATYTMLIAGAQACGANEVANVCEKILQQEKAMAAWLAEHMPGVVQKYLERERAGEESKR